MKLGPVTKIDIRNTAKSKQFNDDIMSTNCDVIFTFSIYGQFINLLSHKNWKQN